MRFLPTIAARLKSLWPPLPSVVRRLLPQNGTDGLAPSIYGYILHHSLREQIYLVVVTLISFPFLCSSTWSRETVFRSIRREAYFASGWPET